MSNHTIQPEGRSRASRFTVVMPQVAPREPLLTEDQIAAYLGVCRRCLFAWRKSGLIPSFKIGKAVRYRLSEVEKALESMRMKP